MERKKEAEIRPGDTGDLAGLGLGVATTLANSLDSKKSASVYLRSTTVSCFRGRA